jgi:Spy/CpxP family protein refolding chaperone
MSIFNFKTPTLPLALGLILSAGVVIGGAPAFAQGAADDATLQPTNMTAQAGGVEILLNGDEAEVVETPQLAAMLPPQAMEAFAMEGGHGAWGHHSMFSEGNKLSDDQLERLYAIKEDSHEQSALKKVQSHILGRKLKDTLSAANIDTAAAKDLEGKIISLKSEIATIHMDALIKMAQVLTPEQRHEVRMHMLRGSMGHHGHHGHWGHHGGEGGPSHEHH